MANLISLHLRFGDKSSKILINPLFIEFVEKRKWNSELYSEIGLMSGKSFEVTESPEEIEKFLTKSVYSVSTWEK